LPRSPAPLDLGGEPGSSGGGTPLDPYSEIAPAHARVRGAPQQAPPQTAGGVLGLRARVRRACAFCDHRPLRPHRVLDPCVAPPGVRLLRRAEASELSAGFEMPQCTNSIVSTATALESAFRSGPLHLTG